MSQGEMGGALMRFGTRLAAVAVYAMSLAVIAPVVSADGPEIMWVEGDVILSGDFSGSIMVIGSDVTLDCAGHRIQGPGFNLGTDDPDIQAGVVVEGGTTGVAVKNCVISGFTTSTGIVVGGSSTTVENNVVDDSQIGISVFANDNTIVGNTVANSQWDGFLIRGNGTGESASGNLLKGNHAQDNVSNFSLEFANGNTLVDNVALGDRVMGLGFQIASSSENVLRHNTATRVEIGFALSDAERNTLSGNSASGSGFGFQLWDSSDNTLVGNTAHDNEVDGFSLVSSTRNEVRDNESYRNGVGFAVTDAANADNILAGNTAEENGFGFFLFNSSGNTLQGNLADGNEDGYQLWGAQENTLKGNFAYGNRAGFVLYDASANTLKGNVGSGNAFHFDDDPFGNVLKGNTGCFQDAEEWEGSNEFKENDFSCTILRVLAHEFPPFTEFMEDYNSDFEAANVGVIVDMSVVPADDMADEIPTRLEGQDVDVVDYCAAPCAGFSNAVQGYMSDVDPPLWQQLIVDGLIMDLSDEAFVNNFNEAAIHDAATFNERVYAINMGRVAYGGMFVNNDLLADADLDLPTTWGMLVKACETITTVSGKECMTVGGGDGWPVYVGSYGLLGAMYPDQAGLVEDLWTGDFKWNVDGLDLFERYRIYATDMLGASAGSSSHNGATEAFADGNTAFMPTGTWQAANLGSLDPGFDWTYIPFPGSDDPEDNQYLFGKHDLSFMIAEDTLHPDLAKAYLAGLSEPFTYQAFVDATAFLPTQPTAVLGGTIGEAVAPYLEEGFSVGFEQYWVYPPGTGEDANGSFAPMWFEPFGEWTDAEALAGCVQARLEGLDGAVCEPA